MRPFVTLLKREWLESRLPFLWLPAGLLGFLIAIGLLLLSVSGLGQVEIVWTTDGTLPNPFFAGLVAYTGSAVLSTSAVRAPPSWADVSKV